MSHLSITLQQLRVFQAVASMNSFSLAAHAIGITQSAVSHSIRHLEAALGVQLFDRKLGTRGYKLSGQGRLLFNHVAAVLSEVERLYITAEGLRKK